MEKKMVRKVTRYIIDEIVEKPLSMDEFILKLKGIEQSLKEEGWSDIEVKLYSTWDYSEINITGMRLETDEEFEKRKKKEEAKLKRQQKKLEREKQKYEELKKKFGDN